MITIIKLAGISAVLSAGVVTAYDTPKVVSGPAKAHHERILPEAPAPVVLADASAVVPKGAAVSDTVACAGQTWPYISRDCVTATEGGPVRKVVRTITVERRDAPNTSTLVRMEASAVPVR